MQRPRIRTCALGKDRALPLLIEPVTLADAGIDALLGWVGHDREWLRRALADHGALLFRGFGVTDAARLEQFTQSAGYSLMGYAGGVTPRRRIRGRIYTSTEATPGAPIPLHQEMSYSREYPTTVAFCCEVPARERGETPIADMQRVLERLPTEVVDRFDCLGVSYEHRVPDRDSRSRLKCWQDRFDTEDRSRVQAICSAQGVELEWLPNGAAKLTHRRPGVVRHPSGARVWFNQAHVYHGSFSDELRHVGQRRRAVALKLVEGLRRKFPRALPPAPFQARYGDGSPIPLAVMRVVREAIWAETVLFSWRRGDLLLVDNVRVAHGRMPYAGERRVFAALIAGDRKAPARRQSAMVSKAPAPPSA